MKKVLIFAVVLLVLSGCGKAERLIASATGYSRICVEGVSYLQFPSGASVEYSPDGKIKTCR